MAPPYLQVMDDLLKGQELAAQLQGLLRGGSPEAGVLTDQILSSFSRAILAVDAAAKGSEPHAGKRKSAAAMRVASRRRTQQASGVTKTTKDLDDGQAWRKYGQKDIHNSKHPKAYFRCTHKYDQQCMAQRQVQRCDDDSDTFRVTYIGEHTCRDPVAAACLDAGSRSRLIIFSHAATASTTTTSTAANGAAGVVQSLKQESGEQEEVLSSLTPGTSAAAVAAAAAPGPDHGDVTSTLQHTYTYGDCSGMEELLDCDILDLDDIFSGVI